MKAERPGPQEPRVLVRSAGGCLCLPARCMIDRADGGNLLILPPRTVWDCSGLDRGEFLQWSMLIAAAGRAMLDGLPQLAGGVINYWEAGNWALNVAAAPEGPKSGERHKRVHMHLIGRSPGSSDPDWRWGEAPRFPRFKDADAWMATKMPLTVDECRVVARRTAELLVEKYGVDEKVVRVF